MSSLQLKTRHPRAPSPLHLSASNVSKRRNPGPQESSDTPSRLFLALNRQEPFTIATDFGTECEESVQPSGSEYQGPRNSPVASVTETENLTRKSKPQSCSKRESEKPRLKIITNGLTGSPGGNRGPQQLEARHRSRHGWVAKDLQDEPSSDSWTGDEWYYPGARNDTLSKGSCQQSRTSFKVDSQPLAAPHHQSIEGYPRSPLLHGCNRSPNHSWSKGTSEYKVSPRDQSFASTIRSLAHEHLMQADRNTMTRQCATGANTSLPGAISFTNSACEVQGTATPSKYARTRPGPRWLQEDKHVAQLPSESDNSSFDQFRSYYRGSISVKLVPGEFEDFSPVIVMHSSSESATTSRQTSCGSSGSGIVRADAMTATLVPIAETLPNSSTMLKSDNLPEPRLSTERSKIGEQSREEDGVPLLGDRNFLFSHERSRMSPEASLPATPRRKGSISIDDADDADIEDGDDEGHMTPLSPNVEVQRGPRRQRHCRADSRNENNLTGGKKRCGSLWSDGVIERLGASPSKKQTSE